MLHDGGPFPTLRLRSLFAQTHPIFELVVLDAGEDLLDTVNAEAEAADRDVALGLGVADGLGEAVAMAGGEFRLDRRSRGGSDPCALAALAAALRAEPQAAFAFCDTQAADEEGRPLYARPTRCRRRQRFGLTDRTFEGSDSLTAGRRARAAPGRRSCGGARRSRAATAKCGRVKEILRVAARAAETRARSHVAEASGSTSPNRRTIG